MNRRLTQSERRKIANNRRATFERCAKDGCEWPPITLILDNGYAGIASKYVKCTDEQFFAALDRAIPLCRHCHLKHNQLRSLT